MDREKVIKGFTVCSEHGLLNGEDCHGHYEYTDNLADIIKANDYSKQCPYNGCRTGCVKTLAKDVLALLKEQETVVLCKDCKHRPIKSKDYENGFDLEFPDSKCPCQCEDDGWYSWYPPDNWFCGNRERKDT